MTDISVSLPAKRKRGRPRKDGNLSREGSCKSPSLLNAQRIEVVSPTAVGIQKFQQVNINSKNGNSVDGMVGSMIYGVIEGSFDAGYLISVRIGNNDTPFRGVVFQPGKFVPITAANDVAPQARMYQRREIPVPAYENPSQISGLGPQPTKQAVVRPILHSMPQPVNPYSHSNQSNFMVPDTLRTSSYSNVPRSPTVGVNQQSPPVHPTGSLRMVEQDEVMQAFEVSPSPKGSKNNTATTGDMVSESSFKATTDGLSGKESINQKPQVCGKAVESELGSSMATHNKLHQNFMGDMAQSGFGVQQDEMICHEMDQHRREFAHDGMHSPTIELQETPVAAPIHSVSREPEAMKTEQQRPPDLYYNQMKSPDANFHQDLFTSQSQPDMVSKSPNLNLDLASAAHEKKPLQQEPQHSDACLETNYMVLNQLKSPNHGYHQALVAGNPLLLPPDIMGEPLEFMMDKGKSHPNNRTPQDANMELESRAVGSGERFHVAGGVSDAMSNAEAASSPYKLELATPQSTLNRMPGKHASSSSAGCITDMDFVLSDVVQPTEPDGHQNVISENKPR